MLGPLLSRARLKCDCSVGEYHHACSVRADAPMLSPPGGFLGSSVAPVRNCVGAPVLRAARRRCVSASHSLASLFRQPRQAAVTRHPGWQAHTRFSCDPQSGACKSLCYHNVDTPLS
jgi:hypothetical protein